MSRLNPAAILHEDNHLLIINKPAGLLTQPVPGDSRDSLEELAKGYLKEKFSKPGKVFLHAVHRIDRQVSGLVIFARTDKALSRLNQAMRARRISKIYHALVEGMPAAAVDQPVELRHYLRHLSHHAKISDRPAPGSRLATLRYTIIGHNDAMALLQIDLDTGRYHQIRAQLAHIGHPIAGDGKYGARRPFGSGDQIGLHSYAACIPHPVSGELLELTAPYPRTWQEILTGID